MENKKRAHIAFPLLLFMISVVLLVGVNLYRFGKTQQLRRMIADANGMLFEGDSKGAQNVYEYVLNEDANNSYACEGMMQLAYETGDRQLLDEYYDRWLDIQIENGNTSDERIGIMGGIINDMEKRKDLNGISALIAEGDYASAQGALQELAATGKGEEADRAQADMLLYLAAKDMKLRNFDRAVEYLEKAMNLNGDDAKVQQLYAEAGEYRLKAALDRHDTAAAEELANATGITAYESDIKREKQRLEHFNAIAEDLKTAFDNEDMDALYGLLNDEELKADAAGLRQPYILQGQVSGAGSVAFYSVNNRLYIYYGTIKEGLREGDGKWACIASDKRLVIYSLKWEKDLPEGEGSCDRYSAPPVNEEDPYTAIHEHDEFTAVHGIMDGRYSMKTEVNSEWPYEYSVEYDLENGYCPRIEPGEYPELIDLYNAYPAPLAGWTEADVYDPAWKKEYTTTIWFIWTPTRWSVDGSETGVIPAKTPTHTETDETF